MSARSVGSRVAAAVAGMLLVLAAFLPAIAGAQTKLFQVKVGTVPTLPGVRLQIGTQVAVTGADGTAQFAVSDRRTVGQHLEVLDAQVDVSPGVRARFDRILGSGSNGDSVRVAFDIDQSVSLQFVGAQGARVQPAEVATVTIKSSVGDRLEFGDVEAPRWLQRSRVVSSARGPEIRPVQWSIEEVIVQGASVIHRSGYRFVPDDQPMDPVELLIFSADFEVNDVLLGHPAGSSLSLLFLDGTKRTYDLNEKGAVTIEKLPRGEYHVVVNGSGPAFSRPVSITRNQEVPLEFYTWFNVAVFGFGGFLCAACPLSLGVYLRRRARRDRSSEGVKEQGDRATNLATTQVRVTDADTTEARESVTADAEVLDLTESPPIEPADAGAGERERWHVSIIPVRVGLLQRRFVVAVLDEATGGCLSAFTAHTATNEDLNAAVALASQQARKRHGQCPPVTVVMPTKTTERTTPAIITPADGATTIVEPHRVPDTPPEAVERWRAGLRDRTAGFQLPTAASVITAVDSARDAHNREHPYLVGASPNLEQSVR